MKYPAMKLLMIIFSLPSPISILVCRRVVGGMELLVPRWSHQPQLLQMNILNLIPFQKLSSGQEKLRSPQEFKECSYGVLPVELLGSFESMS